MFPRRVSSAAALLVALWGAGCAFVTDKEVASRLDVDGDGWSYDTDCDDTDPDVTVLFWYVDADRDGYGDPDAPQELSCVPRAGLSEVAGDCDDARPLAFPGASEICNRLDDDCDGRADEDAVDLRTYYRDDDGDGLGNAESPVETCFAPDQHVQNGRDCDDSDPTTSAALLWYRDDDGDGYGNVSSSALSCEAPTGFVAVAGDCDDTNAGIHPDATEVCDVADAVDEDCDGLIDDDDDSVVLGLSAVDAWVDSDGDGLGDALVPTERCHTVDGWVDNRDDCDDTDALVGSAPCEVLDLAAGALASCALYSDHRVDCWGDADISTNVPPGTFVDVSVGFAHACGLQLDGTLACWGNPPADSFESTYNLTEVGIDSSYTCALTDPGELECWWGGLELSLGVPADSFDAIAVGSTHACGLTKTGLVRCLGACDNGECAVGTSVYAGIAAGREFTCLLDSDGDVACVGRHLGLPGAGPYVSIDGYGRQVCGLSSGGLATCWTSQVAGTVDTPPATSFSMIAVGANHGCGVSAATGAIECWGDDSAGQASPP